MEDSISISPAAMMDIIDRTTKAIWKKFTSHKDVERYIRRWYDEGMDNNGFYTCANFDIITQGNGEIVLPATLDSMNDELLFQVAVDLNIEIPNLIYSVAEIKGILADRYEDVSLTFEKANKALYSDPSIAILIARSALEIIIKKICSDTNIKSAPPKSSLYDLTQHILKQFNFYPDAKLNKNIRNIGSGLLNTSQAIEQIRSNHTEAHGTEAEIISEPLYAMLVVNSVSTVGLFLLNYYEKHYRPPEPDDEIPF